MALVQAVMPAPIAPRFPGAWLGLFVGYGVNGKPLTALAMRRVRRLLGRSCGLILKTVTERFDFLRIPTADQIAAFWGVEG